MDRKSRMTCSDNIAMLQGLSLANLPPIQKRPIATSSILYLWGGLIEIDLKMDSRNGWIHLHYEVGSSLSTHGT